MAGFLFSTSPAHAEGSPVIKDGMKKLHKGDASTIKKVLGGTGTDQDIKALQDYYKSIVAEKPSRGEEASWKEKTAALNKAIDAVAAKDPAGMGQLKEAVNCKACHKVHKAD